MDDSSTAAQYFGRKSTYTFEKAVAICELMAADALTFQEACKRNGVSPFTASYWRKDRPEFAEMFSIARQIAAETMVQDTFTIVDDVDEDRDAIAKAKLRAEHRRWTAGRVDPKAWGDKVQMGGAEDLPPLELRDRRLEEFTRRIASLTPDGAAGKHAGDVKPG